MYKLPHTFAQGVLDEPHRFRRRRRVLTDRALCSCPGFPERQAHQAGRDATPGDGDAREQRDPARLRAHDARRGLRQRMAARAGPLLPDGHQPAHRRRHARRAAGHSGAEQRRAAAHVRTQARGRSVAASAVGRSAHVARRLRPGREHIHLQSSASRRVRTARSDDRAGMGCSRLGRRRQADRVRSVVRPRHRCDGRADLRIRRPGRSSASTVFFFNDTWRVAPFSKAATIPDATGAGATEPLRTDGEPRH